MKEVNQRGQRLVSIPIRSRADLRWLLPLVAAVLLLPVGCGGGGGTGNASTNDPSSHGRLVLRIKWPAPTKAAISRRKTLLRGLPPGSQEGIPTGTLAIVVAVNDLNTGAALATPIKVIAPNGGFNPTQDVEFDNLPVRLVSVSANAYPDTAAQQLPLATGSATGQVLADIVTPITVPLEVTASTIAATPDPIVLQSSGSMSSTTLTAVVSNAMGQPVQFPIEFFNNNPNVITVTPDPMIRGKATVTAVNPGSTSIFILEPNSPLSTFVNVTVSP